MSQVLIVIVIVFGSILNLLAQPWSSTDSMLERRRNDLISVLLWFVLGVIGVLTIHSGIANRKGPEAFDLQDWTALVLPFALASPYLLELVATLVRQIEMWRWIRKASVQALPLAWLYRTMTVGEVDVDGQWIRSRAWASWERQREGCIINHSNSFWSCTSRQASLFYLFRKWVTVLTSAVRYTSRRTVETYQKGKYLLCIEAVIGLVFVSALTAFMLFLLTLSSIELAGLLLFDYGWWISRRYRGIIIARYDTIHFGRQEMHSIFRQSLKIKQSIHAVGELDVNKVHDRIMGALITTTAVLENAFRKAYLVVPVYDVPISNRKALRERYKHTGCDLDSLIKQVRVLLEQKHLWGLLSITSTTGTIEASLHNNIESILSVAIFFPSGLLYHITARIADIEADIEERLNSDARLSSEKITRERVVYIDARNAMFWLLWILVTREWNDPLQFWRTVLSDKLGTEEYVRISTQFPNSRTEILYVIATFLSRCRYCDRYGFIREDELYAEVHELGRLHGLEAIKQEFVDLSNALLEHRSLTLLDWIAREYNLTWTKTDVFNGPLECSWDSDTGLRSSAECEIALV